MYPALNASPGICVIFPTEKSAIFGFFRGARSPGVLELFYVIEDQTYICRKIPPTPKDAPAAFQGPSG